MRIAALYDIHANLPALEAVLSELSETPVDLIVVGGDTVPGPMPRETLEMLAELQAPTGFIHGNGETDVLAASRGGDLSRVPPPFHEVVRWTAAELSADQLRNMERWPLTVRIESEALGRLLFCHATPRDDNEMFTRRTPDERLRPWIAAAEADVIVCGHTHMQFDRSVDGVRVVNAGSVGMPFGPAGAYWLLLDDDLSLRRTAYDLEDAARRVRATAYPQAEEFAAGSILEPPSEEAMLAAFG